MENSNNLYSILPDGRWKIKFDHHMISNFSTCEMLFKERHIPNEKNKVIKMKGGFSWTATFGIWWAHALEDYYNHVERAQRNEAAFPTRADLVKYAIRWWLKDDMDRFAIVAPAQYNKFCVGWMQIECDGVPVKFPQGAVQLATGYADFADKLQDRNNWKVIATESAFGVLGDVIVAENDRVVVCYQGRPDLVVYDNNKCIVVPVDHKTTADVNGDFVFNWKPNAQLLGYEVATAELCKQLNIATTIQKSVINGISRDVPAIHPKQGLPKSRFRRIDVEHTPSEIAEWRHQMIARGSRLRDCIERDEWIWKESACHNQYGYPCEYKEIHRRPPEQRLMAIQQGYQQVDPWDVRGNK